MSLPISLIHQACGIKVQEKLRVSQRFQYAGTNSPKYNLTPWQCRGEYQEDGGSREMVAEATPGSTVWERHKL